MSLHVPRPRLCRSRLEDVPGRLRGAPWWKVIGMAGLAGVAATGVLVTRGERRRQTMSPDEVRARLHQRYAELGDPVAGRPDDR